MTTTKCWGVKLPYAYWMRLRGILTMVWMRVPVKLIQRESTLPLD